MIFCRFVSHRLGGITAFWRFLRRLFQTPRIKYTLCPQTHAGKSHLYHTNRMTTKHTSNRDAMIAMMRFVAHFVLSFHSSSGLLTPCSACSSIIMNCRSLCQNLFWPPSNQPQSLTLFRRPLSFPPQRPNGHRWRSERGGRTLYCFYAASGKLFCCCWPDNQADIFKPNYWRILQLLHFDLQSSIGLTSSS